MANEENKTENRKFRVTITSQSRDFENQAEANDWIKKLCDCNIFYISSMEVF